MCDYPKKSNTFLDWKSSWNQAILLIILLWIVCLISGCTQTSSKQLYENSKSGINLEGPENWDVAFYERSGIIVLETKKGFGTKDSARVEIHGAACVFAPTWFDPDEQLESNIDRIRILYSLDTIKVVQEPMKIKTGDYEITKATVTVPTTSMPEGSVENQVGGRGPDIFQTIDLFGIKDSENNFIMAYVYRGNSKVLNAQAQEIVDSVQLTCASKP